MRPTVLMMATAIAVASMIAVPADAQRRKGAERYNTNLPVGQKPDLSGASTDYKKCFTKSYKRYPGGSLNHRARQTDIQRC